MDFKESSPMSIGNDPFHLGNFNRGFFSDQESPDIEQNVHKHDYAVMQDGHYCVQTYDQKGYMGPDTEPAKAFHRNVGLYFEELNNLLADKTLAGVSRRGDLSKYTVSSLPKYNCYMKDWVQLTQPLEKEPITSIQLKQVELVQAVMEKKSSGDIKKAVDRLAGTVADTIGRYKRSNEADRDPDWEMKLNQYMRGLKQKVRNLCEKQVTPPSAEGWFGVSDPDQKVVEERMTELELQFDQLDEAVDQAVRKPPFGVKVIKDQWTEAALEVALDREVLKDEMDAAVEAGKITTNDVKIILGQNEHLKARTIQKVKRNFEAKEQPLPVEVAKKKTPSPVHTPVTTSPPPPLATALNPKARDAFAKFVESRHNYNKLTADDFDSVSPFLNDEIVEGILEDDAFSDGNLQMLYAKAQNIKPKQATPQVVIDHKPPSPVQSTKKKKQKQRKDQTPSPVRTPPQVHTPPPGSPTGAVGGAVGGDADTKKQFAFEIFLGSAQGQGFTLDDMARVAPVLTDEMVAEISSFGKDSEQHFNELLAQLQSTARPKKKTNQTKREVDAFKEFVKSVYNQCGAKTSDITLAREKGLITPEFVSGALGESGKDSDNQLVMFATMFAGVKDEWDKAQQTTTSSAGNVKSKKSKKPHVTPPAKKSVQQPEKKVQVDSPAVSTTPPPVTTPPVSPTRDKPLSAEEATLKALLQFGSANNMRMPDAKLNVEDAHKLKAVLSGAHAQMFMDPKSDEQKVQAAVLLVNEINVELQKTASDQKRIDKAFGYILQIGGTKYSEADRARIEPFLKGKVLDDFQTYQGARFAYFALEKELNKSAGSKPVDVQKTTTVSPRKETPVVVPPPVAMAAATAKPPSLKLKKFSPQQKDQLFRDLMNGGAVLTRPEFDSFIDKLDPDRVFSDRKPSFVEQFNGFALIREFAGQEIEYQRKRADDREGEELTSLQISQIKQGLGKDVQVRQLNFDHFVTMVNANLLSVPELNNLHSDIGDAAARGIVSRLDQQHLDEKFVGPAFTTWGDTCWINTALHGLIHGVSPEMLSHLEATTHRNPSLNKLQQSFCRLMRAGKAMVDNKEGGVLTGLQVDFIEDCMKCGKEGLLGGMSGRFAKDKIVDITQSSSSEFIDSIYGALGLHNDPGCTVQGMYEKVATVNGQKVVAYDFIDQSGSINCFFPTEFDPNNIRMSHWIDSVREPENRRVDWTAGQLAGVANIQGAMSLPTDRQRMHKVDSRQFRKMRISLGDNDMRELQRAAFLADGKEFKLPVLLEDGKPYYMKLKLSAVALHAADYEETNVRARLADLGKNTENDGSDRELFAAAQKKGGHYLMMTLDKDSQATLHDDSWCLSFEQFAELRNHKPGGKDPWHNWEDMMRKSNYAPAYCYYDVAGYEPREEPGRN